MTHHQNLPTQADTAASPDTRALLAGVVEVTRTCPTPIWGFGVGGCLTGLVAAGRQLRRPELVDEVSRRLAGSLDGPPGPTDHLISVETLLALRDRLPAAALERGLERWITAVRDAARPFAQQPRVHRPDSDRWNDTIWVDCLHTDGPGFALLGMADTAVDVLEESAAALQRPDGLFDHGYDVSTGRGNNIPWGRGQGWALLGLVDTLAVTADAVLLDRLSRLIHAMAQHERNGTWHTIVDDERSPIENSTAAYIALGLDRALRHGLVDPSYAAMASRAWSTIIDRLHAGALAVSAATPVGDRSIYLTPDIGTFAWGQAPVLQRLLQQTDTTEDIA